MTQSIITKFGEKVAHGAWMKTLTVTRNTLGLELRLGGAAPYSAREDMCSELVMGHFFKTQPNPKFLDPTHKSSPNPTQPIIGTWYGILGYTENIYNNCYLIFSLLTLHSTSQLSMKVIIQLQYSLTDSRVGLFHDVKDITQSSLHRTQPNPPNIKKTLT